MSYLDELEARNRAQQEQAPQGNMLKRIGMGAANAPSAFLNDFVSLGEDVAGWLSGVEHEWSKVPKFFDDKELGTAGKVSEEFVSFAGGVALAWTGIGALANAGKLGKVSQAAAWLQKMNKGRLAQRIVANGIVGAGADFVMGGTEDGNFSNLVQQFPALKNPISNMLMHDDDDGNLEKRLKNAIEGIPLGFAAETAMDGLGKVIRFRRAKIDQAVAEGASRENLVAREIGGTVAATRGDLNMDQFKPNPIRVKPEVNADGAKGIGEFTPATVAKNFHEAYITGQRDDMTGIIREGIERFVVGEGKKLEDALNFKHWSMSVDNGERFELLNTVNAVMSDRGIIAKMNPQTLKSITEDGIGFLKECLGDDNALASIIANARNDEAILAGLAGRLSADRMLLSSMEDSISDIIKMYRQGTPNEEDMLKALVTADSFFELFASVKNMGTYVARTLRAHGINIGDGVALSGKGGKLGSIGEAVQAERIAEIRKIFQEKGGIKRFGEFADSWEKLARDKHGKISAREAYKEVTKPKGFTKALLVAREFTATNMLCGSSTQGVNIISTAGHVVLQEVLEPFIAATKGMLQGSPDRITYREVGARIAGAWDQIGSFWKNFGRGMWNEYSEHGMEGIGKNFEKIMGSVDPTGGTNRAEFEGIQKFITSEYLGINKDNFAMKPIAAFVDSYGKTARTVSYNTMGVFDSMNKNAAYRSELEGSLVRAASFMELAPGQAVEFKTQMRKWVFDYAYSGKLPKISDKGQAWIMKIHNSAKDGAVKSAFQEELDPKSLAGKFSGWLNQQENNPLLVKTFLIPFFKTPVNLLNATVERTPLINRMLKVNREIMRSGTQAQKDMLMAKTFSGAMMYMSFASLYWSAQLTGSHRNDERDDLLNAGVPEYSIKIGNSWYSYNRLDPLGYFAGIAADIFSAGRSFNNNGDVGELVSALLAVSVDNIVNKSYMRSLGDTYNAVNDPARYGQAWLRGQAGKFIPLHGVQRTVNTVISPEMREVRNLADAFTNGWIGGKQALPVKLDSLGREVVADRSPWAILLGINRVDMQDEASQQIAKFRVYPRDTASIVKGVKMTDEEHYQMKEILGKLGVRDRVNDLVQTSAYRGSSDAVKEKTLKSFINKYQSYAREIMLANTPELRSRILDKRREELKRALLSPDNTGRIDSDINEIRDWARNNK